MLAFQANQIGIWIIFFELELANTGNQEKKPIGARKRMNLDSGTAVKCTVFGFVGFSVGLTGIKCSRTSVCSPENEVCPFFHILCKPQARRDTESPGDPVHNEF